MPKEEKKQQTEQTPKGLTVPVPKREMFFDNLKKIAKPDERVKNDEGGTSPRSDPPAE